MTPDEAVALIRDRCRSMSEDSRASDIRDAADVLAKRIADLEDDLDDINDKAWREPPDAEIDKGLETFR